MKITLFTTNLKRHNYFIKILSDISDELFVIQECKTIFSGIVPNHYPCTKAMKEYFSQVMKAQEIVFGKKNVSIIKKNVKHFSLKFGELNKYSLKFLKDFLKSDIYIIFGSSYIKGDLVNFLIKNRAINIHMGVSPYYRGADCNFWALYDSNYHLVGSTIHYLSKGIDSGDIIYHALSEQINDPFVYTMSTVKSAIHSLGERIKNGSILKYKTEKQSKDKIIRYTKKIEFTDKVIMEFLKKKIKVSTRFNKTLLKDPFFLK